MQKISQYKSRLPDSTLDSSNSTFSSIEAQEKHELDANPSYQQISLTEAGAAKYLNVSVSSLRQGRMNGLREKQMPPPPFIRLGRKILYLVSDLQSFIEAHRVKPPATREPVNQSLTSTDVTRGLK